jgi:hypothetical protein
MKTLLLNFWEKRIMSMDVPNWFLFAQVLVISLMGILLFISYLS